MTDRMTFCAPCLLGVEGLVAEELREMGCEAVRAENGRVLFEGDASILARANLHCRYAERILILLKDFRALTFDELFEGVKSIPWENFLGKEDEFPVSGSSLSSKLHSVPDCQAIIKKATVERLKGKYGISWFSETGPLHKIRFRILKNEVSIMLDTSGEGLHKRGYRRNSAEAPIKETLAACLVKLSRVRDDGYFIDPFCGSGTLLIEAAMLAMHMAPGANRKFQAEAWRETDLGIWKRERERAVSLARTDVPFRAMGYDVDAAAVGLALDNARKAGVIAHVKAGVRDVRDFSEDAEYGCVVCNPPYGERLMDLRSVQELIGAMGRVFERKRGWSYGIITPDDEFEAQFGRKADKRRKLYNGMIRCQFYQFFK